MRKLLSLGVVSLFIGMSTISGSTVSGSPVRGVNNNVRNRFCGAWRLMWLEEPGADGNIYKANCTGLLVYTRDGHMSVRVMHRHPKAGTAAGPVQYAQNGYEGSYGTYKIKDTRSFTYHVDGAFVRSLVGKDFTRVFELTGKRLS